MRLLLLGLCVVAFSTKLQRTTDNNNDSTSFMGGFGFIHHNANEVGGGGGGVARDMRVESGAGLE